MLKKAAGCILASLKACDVWKYAPRLLARCGFAGQLF
jgi:hypothetical protein